MKLVVTTLAMLLVAVTAYPVYSPDAGEDVDTCSGITCKTVECKPPFVWKSAKDVGTCCPVCFATSIKVPEDRSWTAGLSGGVGMNNNADPILCRNVMCPPLHCPEFEQIFDDRCCTKCKTAAATTPADLAA
mmetsp:Transcript_77241/g.136836  ORF Transcript_77241/g.136836 Transcript_77241/m.136836 type:complete len:132 (+) Transcript_77241:69-464(+)